MKKTLIIFFVFIRFQTAICQNQSIEKDNLTNLPILTEFLGIKFGSDTLSVIKYMSVTKNANKHSTKIFGTKTAKIYMMDYNDIYFGGQIVEKITFYFNGNHKFYNASVSFYVTNKQDENERMFYKIKNDIDTKYFYAHEVDKRNQEFNKESWKNDSILKFLPMRKQVLKCLWRFMGNLNEINLLYTIDIEDKNKAAITLSYNDKSGSFSDNLKDY